MKKNNIHPAMKTHPLATCMVTLDRPRRLVMSRESLELYRSKAGKSDTELIFGNPVKNIKDLALMIWCFASVEDENLSLSTVIDHLSVELIEDLAKLLKAGSKQPQPRYSFTAAGRN